jgi:hypothetical protein
MPDGEGGWDLRQRGQMRNVISLVCFCFTWVNERRREMKLDEVEG